MKKTLLFSLFALMYIFPSFSYSSDNSDKNSNRKWSSCAKGGALGAIAAGGLALGAGKKKKKALLAGIAGGIAGCAIAAQLSSKDKKNMQDNDISALSSGTTESKTTWVDEKGVEKTYTTKVKKISTEKKAGTKTVKKTRKSTFYGRGQAASCARDPSQYVCQDQVKDNDFAKLDDKECRKVIGKLKSSDGTQGKSEVIYCQAENGNWQAENTSVF